MFINLFKQLNQTERAPLSIYQILKSAAYEETEEPDPMTLIKEYKNTIFDFNYPISDEQYNYSLDTDWFEESILQHYIMRRIGFNTLGEFKRALQIKLWGTMPYLLKKRALITTSEEFLKLTTFIEDSTEITGTSESESSKGKTDSGTDTEYLDIEIMGIASGDTYINKTITEEYSHSETGQDSSDSTLSGSSTGTSSMSTNNTVTGDNTTTTKTSELPQTSISSMSNDTFVSDVNVSNDKGTDKTSSSTSGTNQSSNNGSNSSNSEYNITDSYHKTNKIISFPSGFEVNPNQYDHNSANGTTSNTHSESDTTSGSNYSMDYTVNTNPEYIEKLLRALDRKGNWLSEVYKTLDDLFLNYYD